MKSYRTTRGSIHKMMCFFPAKGVPKAVTEAFVVISGNVILAVGKTEGRVDAMNGGMDPMPLFPARAQKPIVFSLKTRTVIPSLVKSGVPKWRIEPTFKRQTNTYFDYWNGADRMVAMGDVSQREAEDGTDSD